MSFCGTFLVHWVRYPICVSTELGVRISRAVVDKTWHPEAGGEGSVSEPSRGTLPSGTLARELARGLLPGQPVRRRRLGST